MSPDEGSGGAFATSEFPKRLADSAPGLFHRRNGNGSLPTGEVVVQRSFRRTAGFHDVVEAGSGVAAPTEQRNGGIDYRLAVLLPACQGSISQTQSFPKLC